MKRRKLSRREEVQAYADATTRDKDTCVRCGRGGVMDRDHRQNRDSFNTVVSNLQLLGSDFGCGHHRWKTEHPEEATRQGFSVPRWAVDHREWPAYRYGVGWVLYFDEPDDRGDWWLSISAAEARAIQKRLGL